MNHAGEARRTPWLKGLKRSSAESLMALYLMASTLFGWVAGLVTWYYICLSIGWVAGLALGWIPGLIVSALVGFLWPLAAVILLAGVILKVRP